MTAKAGDCGRGGCENSDAGHEYKKPGRPTICVKVVDVFGCDTSNTADVEA